MLQRMLNRLRGANDDEKGFTLIELLVVILIIGILAAIALPTFLGQQKKAQDSSAKSDARNAVTQVESCLTDVVESNAASCGVRATNPGLSALGTDVAASGVSLTNGAPVFTVTATSKSGHTFSIAKAATGVVTYSAAEGTAADGFTDAKWVENTTT